MTWSTTYSILLVCQASLRCIPFSFTFHQDHTLSIGFFCTLIELSQSKLCEGYQYYCFILVCLRTLNEMRYIMRCCLIFEAATTRHNGRDLRVYQRTTVKDRNGHEEDGQMRMRESFRSDWLMHRIVRRTLQANCRK